MLDEEDFVLAAIIEFLIILFLSGIILYFKPNNIKETNCIHYEGKMYCMLEKDCIYDDKKMYCLKESESEQ